MYVILCILSFVYCVGCYMHHTSYLLYYFMLYIFANILHPYIYMHVTVIIMAGDTCPTCGIDRRWVYVYSWSSYGRYCC